MEEKEILNEIVDNMSEYKDFYSLVEEILRENVDKVTYSGYQFLNIDEKTTFDELLYFFQKQWEFIGVDIWKNDWKIIKVALEENTEMQKIFLSFVDEIKKNIKTRKQDIKESLSKKSFYELYELSSQLKNIITKVKDDQLKNEKIEIDYNGKIVEVDEKTLDNEITFLTNYFEHKTVDYQNIVDIQKKWLEKIQNCRDWKWKKNSKFKENTVKGKNAINFDKIFWRLTFEFNNLPWFVGIENYVKVTSWTSLDEEELKTSIMPDDYVLYLQQQLSFIINFYNVLNGSKTTEWLMLKYITTWDWVCSKVYLYNWIYNFFLPIADNLTKDKYKKIVKDVSKESLDLFKNTTALNTLENWQIKTLQHDFYYFWIFKDMIRYVENKKGLMSDKDIQKIRKVLSKILNKTSYNLKWKLEDEDKKKEVKVLNKVFPENTFNGFYLGSGYDEATPVVISQLTKNY